MNGTRLPQLFPFVFPKRSRISIETGWHSVGFVSIPSTETDRHEASCDEFCNSLHPCAELAEMPINKTAVIKILWRFLLLLQVQKKKGGARVMSRNNTCSHRGSKKRLQKLCNDKCKR